MSFTSTAAVLDSIKARIEALTPSTQLNADDRFYVLIDPPNSDVTYESRAVFLSAYAAVPDHPSKVCNQWSSQITLDVAYGFQPSDEGQPTTTQTALRDAEDILADLLLWTTTTDGILGIYPEMGVIAPSGNGFLSCSRIFRVEFQRG